MFTNLFKHYVEKGVIADNQGSLYAGPLYDSCTKCGECWAGLEDRRAEWNKMQIPYVGAKYHGEAHRVLVVGLNLNEFGGLFSLIELAMNAQFALMNHWQKIRFGLTYKEYRGSIFWHRVALYSAIILSDRELHSFASDVLTDFESLAAAMGKIAFVEAVKCSPWDPNTESQPTSTMKANCIETFLIKEIEEMNPETILIMGKETLLLPASSEVRATASSASGNINFMSVDMAGKERRLFKVTHPTARGGNSTDIPLEFRNFLGQMRR
jgi:hypothetical protein